MRKDVSNVKGECISLLGVKHCKICTDMLVALEYTERVTDMLVSMCHVLDAR